MLLGGVCEDELEPPSELVLDNLTAAPLEADVFDECEADCIFSGDSFFFSNVTFGDFLSLSTANFLSESCL